jgi:hypothetical protein
MAPIINTAWSAIQVKRAATSDERISFFSEEVGDSGNDFVKPLQKYYV